jgi:predicted nucleic acid-binding protein
LIYILDACAIIATIKNEKGFDKVKAILNEAFTEQSVIYMHSINLIEVYYKYLREDGKEIADKIIEKIYKLPISFIDNVDKIIFAESSRLKATYAIPLGDAIGLATAIKMNGTFVTADHSDFEKIEKAESLSFFWFR